MDSKELKNMFNKIAQKHNFEKAFGGWFLEGPECIIVLDLQKSKFGTYFQLNLKIFVQGMFGKSYKKNKDLVKKEVGDILSGEPKEYKKIFDLENKLDEMKREKSLNDLFTNFIIPFTNTAITKAGIIDLYQKKKLFLLPAVKKELGVV